MGLSPPKKSTLTEAPSKHSQKMHTVQVHWMGTVYSRRSRLL